jgi:hypothetical protein
VIGRFTKFDLKLLLHDYCPPNIVREQNPAKPVHGEQNILERWNQFPPMHGTRVAVKQRHLAAKKIILL